VFTKDFHISVIFFAIIILTAQLLAIINIYNFFLFANQIERDAKLPVQKIITPIDTQPD